MLLLREFRLFLYALVFTSVFVDVEHEYVHCAHFGELMILAVQPQHLLQSLLGSLFLYIDRGCVVGAHFAIANTAGPRSVITNIKMNIHFAYSFEVLTHSPCVAWICEQ